LPGWYPVNPISAIFPGKSPLELQLTWLERIVRLSEDFNGIRAGLEQVYGQTRILEKPDDYTVDQDYHNHLANQTTSFDWQFTAELFFLEKIEREFP